MATVHNEFRQLLGIHPSGGTLRADLEGGDLTLVDLELDRIGCQFTRLTYQTARMRDWDLRQAKQACQNLAQRLSYLLEPIQLIEADAESVIMQMRSMPPSSNDAGLTYYECLVQRGGRIDFQRFRKEDNLDRSPIRTQLTRETLERLTSDVIQTSYEPAA